MAESAVSSVLFQLANLLTHEAAFLRGVKGQVEWVKTELKRMEAFLKDAESKKRRGDERVANWISEVRGVAYEVEDVIDKVMWMAERQHHRRGFIGSLSRYYHKPSELISLHKIGSKIEQIKKKILDISESRERYGIARLDESGVEKSGDRDDSLQTQRQFPPHFYDDTDIIGLEGDKKKLLEQLVDQENENRRVISIVGMGGLGKTTLARKLFNMDEVKQHFDAFVWLTISQTYKVDEILKNILKKNSSVSKEELDKMTEHELREELYNCFQYKKYLIVMDDVWALDAWDKIDLIFPDKRNGSRMILTTRHIEVAKSIDPWTDPYEMHFLDDAESWELFRRKAFPPNQQIPDQLQDVGRKIATKCGGLPLALVVLGGLMSRKKRDYSAWSEVDNSMEWEFTRDGRKCLEILALSYDDLPYHLKPCFLYIAAFPEDFIISASKLVRLWIAEGFIPQRHNQTLEKTARDFLNELEQRCMIQVVERSAAYGWAKKIRIHDMLHEFSMTEARKDGFLNVHNGYMDPMFHDISSHRAAFHGHINNELVVSSPRLRTLLGFYLAFQDTSWRFLNGLNFLRVLDLEGAEDLKELPEQIGCMISLRYLGLRDTGLQRLPSSVGNLLNLQTLDVRDTMIFCLPLSIWKIRALRHVYTGSAVLQKPASGFHENLQTLQICFSWLDLDSWKDPFKSENFIEAIHAVGFFIKQGLFRYHISQIFRGKIIEKSLKKIFDKKDNLVSLKLPGSSLIGSSPILSDVFFAQVSNMRYLRSLHLLGKLWQQLPDSSQFPANLTKLILVGSKLEEDPMPVLEKLPNLKFLALGESSYAGNYMSNTSGGFPQLQCLMLVSLPYLEAWSVEVGAMLSLTHLSIQECPNLKNLPDGLQHVTTLQELRLCEMHEEFNNRVRKEDRYKVEHIRSIIFEADDWQLDYNSY